MEEPLTDIEKVFIGAAVVLAIAGIYGLYKIWWAAAPEESGT